MSAFLLARWGRRKLDNLAALIHELRRFDACLRGFIQGRDGAIGDVSRGPADAKPKLSNELEVFEHLSRTIGPPEHVDGVALFTTRRFEVWRDLVKEMTSLIEVQYWMSEIAPDLRPLVPTIELPRLKMDGPDPDAMERLDHGLREANREFYDAELRFAGLEALPPPSLRGVPAGVPGDNQNFLFDPHGDEELTELLAMLVGNKMNGSPESQAEIIRQCAKAKGTTEAALDRKFKLARKKSKGNGTGGVVRNTKRKKAAKTKSAQKK